MRVPLIGFACNWDPDERETWSGTPWNLYEELRRQADCVDTGVHLGHAMRAGLKALAVRRRDGRWVTKWKSTRLTNWLVGTLIRRQTRVSNCDASLQTGNLALVDIPFFLYQDSSVDVLLHVLVEDGVLHHFPALTKRDLIRDRAAQQRFYRRAHGILAMSSWFAETLTEWSGVPPERVTVVHAGIQPSLLEQIRATAPRGDPIDQSAPRLLFIGKDFVAKGGDLVVEAFRLLRRNGFARAHLTIAGPRSWPLPGPIPSGICFRGRVPAGELARLYAEHDLFVLPSRFEAFGIAFVEARACGLPCVGRNAFAMPEILDDPTSCRLLCSDDPAELAELICQLIQDPAASRRAAELAPSVRAYYTWERVASDIVSAISAAL